MTEQAIAREVQALRAAVDAGGLEDPQVRATAAATLDRLRAQWRLTPAAFEADTTAALEAGTLQGLPPLEEGL